MTKLIDNAASIVIDNANSFLVGQSNEQSIGASSNPALPKSLTISKNNVFDKDTLFPYSELSNNLPNSSFKDEKVLATCIDLHSLPVDHPMRMFLLNSNQKSSASSESSSELSSSLFPTSEEIVETFKDLML